MSEEKTHDLIDFMRRISDKMAAEYERIQKRASEDPGTAGDQVEENWAKLLRGWLPPTYEVVTKGKILSHEGHASPQVDVLVLKSLYPKKLHTEKHYLAAGVAAAFECKTTLKADHIEKTMKNCVEIKNLYPNRIGTSYKELTAPIVYGLLAHSHTWKRNKSTPKENIDRKLRSSDLSHVTHPRQTLDLLCVADLATWNCYKLRDFFNRSKIETAYGRHYNDSDVLDYSSIVFGSFFSYLWRRLAWEDPTLRDLADYFRRARIQGRAEGATRKWWHGDYDLETLSDEEHSQSVEEANAWNEEIMNFY